MGGLGRSKFTEQMPQGRGGHGAAGCCCRVAGLQGGVVECADRAINSGMGLSTFTLIICVRVRVGMCDRECVQVFVCVCTCVCVCASVRGCKSGNACFIMFNLCEMHLGRLPRPTCNYNVWLAASYRNHTITSGSMVGTAIAVQQSHRVQCVHSATCPAERKRRGSPCTQ